MELKYTKNNTFEKISRIEEDNAYAYTNEYIKFLNKAKTEYECVEEIKDMLEDAGFTDIDTVESVELNDKVYYINKERAIYAMVIGENGLKLGMNIIGAHIDSPRLDTKPMPLFEKQGLALMKTQYYGGIKKYQWLSIPLAMHGVIYTEKGDRLLVTIGEKEDEPVFTITDLLPHLAKAESELKASKFIDPENLAVVVGSVPEKNEKTDKIKTKILNILNKKYGIKEIDFARSDIRFVPNFKASYVGLDKGLVAGYGQDDRVCAYATVKAITNLAKENKPLSKTAVAVLIDKEEIGSEGNTSMSSKAFDMFLLKVMNKLPQESNKDSNLQLLEILDASMMLSADVTAAIDPLHEELSDVQNGSKIGSGVSIEKYTGSGGKYSANDASAKFMAYVMNILDKNDVTYQLGTLGKIEKGGGGTIANILANKGVEVVDCGTALLSMHSPYELASVTDIYMTYKAYMTFFNN